MDRCGWTLLRGTFLLEPAVRVRIVAMTGVTWYIAFPIAATLQIFYLKSYIGGTTIAQEIRQDWAMAPLKKAPPQLIHTGHS